MREWDRDKKWDIQRNVDTYGVRETETEKKEWDIRWDKEEKRRREGGDVPRHIKETFINYACQA